MTASSTDWLIARTRTAQARQLLAERPALAAALHQALAGRLALETISRRERRELPLELREVLDALRFGPLRYLVRRRRRAAAGAAHPTAARSPSNLPPREVPR